MEYVLVVGEVIHIILLKAYYTIDWLPIYMMIHVAALWQCINELN